VCSVQVRSQNVHGRQPTVFFTALWRSPKHECSYHHLLRTGIAHLGGIGGIEPSCHARRFLAGFCLPIHPRRRFSYRVTQRPGRVGHVYPLLNSPQRLWPRTSLPTNLMPPHWQIQRSLPRGHVQTGFRQGMCCLTSRVTRFRRLSKSQSRSHCNAQTPGVPILSVRRRFECSSQWLLPTA
jgi:hypothetical protein